MLAILGGDAAAIELMIAVFVMSVSGGLAAAWRLVRTTPARQSILLSSERRTISMRNNRRVRHCSTSLGNATAF